MNTLPMHNSALKSGGFPENLSSLAKSSHLLFISRILAYIKEQTILYNNANKIHQPIIHSGKRPRGRAVSAPDFGSRGRGFESRWRRDSSRT